MTIWSRPTRISERDIFWFVVLSVMLVISANSLVILFSIWTGNGSYANTVLRSALLTTPIAAIMMYRGVKLLQRSLSLRDDFHHTSHMLAQRNQELEAAQKALHEHAYRDFLTGLCNRRAFQNALQKRIDQAQAGKSGFWLAIMDLDDFKPINDTHGHDAGDSALKNVARQLQRQFTRDDVDIARLGGDEFALIFPDAIAKKYGSAERVAESACLAIGRPFLHQEHTLCVAASAGLAHWNKTMENTLLMMRAGDQALIKAKSDGKGRIHVQRTKTGQAA